MNREVHVRFLGGWGAAMRPGYPVGRGQVVVWPGQLLNHIAQRRLDWRHAEIPAQSAVGDDVNARHLRAAQIEWDAVRFLVIERGQQPLARVHHGCPLN